MVLSRSIPTPAGERRASHQRAWREICPGEYRFDVARLPFTDPGNLLAVNIFRVMAHAPAAAKGFASCGTRILARPTGSSEGS